MKRMIESIENVIQMDKGGHRCVGEPLQAEGSKEEDLINQSAGEG